MKRTINYFIFNVFFLMSNSLFAQGIDGIISGQIANQVTRSTSGSISKNLADNLLIPQLKIRNESGEVLDFSTSPDARLYGLLHKDGSIRVWDAKQGVQRPAIFPGTKTFTKVIPLSSANLALVGTSDGVIIVYDALTGRESRQLSVHSHEILALASSGDEAILVSADTEGSLVLWDLKQLTRIKTIKTTYGDTLKFIALSADGKTLVAAGDDGFIDLWDLEKGEKKLSLPQQSSHIKGIWSTGIASEEIVAVDDDTVLHRFDLKTGRELLKQKLTGEDLLSIAVNTEANLIAVSTETQIIKLLNLTNLAPVKDFKVTDEVRHLKLINQGKQLIGADSKGVLHVWDTATTYELLRLISTDTGWTVVDDKGRFDSSEAGMKNVSWEAANQEIPIDSFSANYYEPGLLATAIEKAPFINKQPKVIQAGINLPPEVNITPAGTDRIAGQAFIVTMAIADAGGGIADLRFYHNGKIVDKSSEVDSVDSEVNGRLNRRVSYKIIPSAGLNQFKTIAVNTMGIDSQPQELSLDFAGKVPQMTLHVVTVGINSYQDDRLNLDYSVADAKSIASILGNKNRVSFNDVVQHEIFDRQATKQEILGQLKIAQASSNDVMVVYLAGHGIAVNGEWYFLPYEARLQDNEQYYAQVGISAREIRDLVAAIPMQKILVMVDSCYSGTGLNAFRNLQNTQRHFGRALSKSTGIVVLAATRPNQKAAESIDLGHGLFTYVVTQGMGGAADSQPKDRKISAHEVVSFSTTTMPTFSKKYTGASQEPTSFTMGIDFNLLGQK